MKNKKPTVTKSTPSASTSASKKAHEIINDFQVQEQFLQRDTLPRWDEEIIALQKKCLHELIELYKRFSAQKKEVERQWRKTSPKSFLYHLIFASQTRIVWISRAYSMQGNMQNVIDFLSEQENRLHTTLEQSEFLSQLKETIYCERAEAYCETAALVDQKNYLFALWDFEQITPDALKKNLEHARIIDLCNYLLNLISPSNLSEYEKSHQITSETAQLIGQQEKNVEIVKEIEQRLQTTINDLIKKYVRLVSDPSKTKEDIVFWAKNILFSLSVFEKQESWASLEERLKSVECAFPSEARLKKQEEESRAKLYLTMANAYKIFIDYVKSLQEENSNRDEFLLKYKNSYIENLYKSAELGNHSAQHHLAISLPKDDIHIRKLQQRSAAQGNFLACYNEAHDLIHKDKALNDEHEIKKILFLLNQAVRHNFLPALSTLADIYAGKFSPCLIEEDREQAIQYYQRMAEYKDPNAWRELGIMFFLQGEAEHIAQAFALWQQAKSYNDIGSMAHLASYFLFMFNHLVLKKDIFNSDINLHWQRVAVSYITQGIMNCQDAINQINKCDITQLSDSEQRLYKNRIIEIKILSQHFLKIASTNKFPNKIVGIFAERVNIIIQQIPNIDEEVGEYGNTYSELIQAKLALSRDIISKSNFEIYHTDNEPSILIEEGTLLSELPLLNMILEIHDVFQDLDSIILTLCEVSLILWAEGANHHQRFEQYNEPIQKLLFNLLDKIKSMDSTYPLSDLCEALLGLGRLRLHPADNLGCQIIEAIATKIINNIEQLSIKDCIETLCTLRFFHTTDALNQLLINLINQLQNNDSYCFSFIEVSKLYYALAVIDANPTFDRMNYHKLIATLNNCVLPYLSRPQPFHYLHQWILAVDYFKLSNKELVKALEDKAEFQHKYQHIYSLREKGNPSYFQNRVQKYIHTLFDDKIKVEVFFGLLPGDFYIQATEEKPGLLFEVDGPSHFSCNTFDNSEKRTLLSTPVDNFHKKYKQLHHPNLQIVSVSFDLSSTNRKREKAQVIQHIRDECKLHSSQPHQSISSSLSQTFLPPPPSLPAQSATAPILRAPTH